MSAALPALMCHQSVSVFAEMAKTQAAAAGQPSGKTVAIHPPRATDAFYAKLLPALEVPACLQYMYSMCDVVVYSKCGVCYLICACVAV